MITFLDMDNEYMCSHPGCEYKDTVDMLRSHFVEDHDYTWASMCREIDFILADSDDRNWL